MKKVALILSGELPVPAVRGGAVENLVQVLLDENEKDPKFEFIIYSISDNLAKENVGEYKYSKFIFINTKSFVFKFLRNIRYLLHRILSCYLGNQFITEVVKKMRDFDFDVIVLENASQFSMPIRKAFPKTKIISHLHNEQIFGGCRYESDISFATDAYLCVSKYICGRTQSAKGVAPSSVFCLYNGIDTERFGSPVSNKERVKLRESIGLKESDFVFIFSGRVVEHKGVFELQRAFALLREKIPDVKLVFLGASGFAGSSVDSGGFDLTNIIFTGFIPYAEMSKYLAIGDVAVLPSIWDDPFPLALLEAITCGLPTILSDSGGMPEVVGEEKCAVIVPRGENFSTRLADKMLLLYNDSSLRLELSQKAQKRGRFFSKERYWNFFVEKVNIILSK